MTDIDDDHKEIFELVAQLQRAASDGAAKADISGLAASLARRIGEHFAHEERLMRAARYGLFSWHRRSHTAARQRVGRLIKRLERGDGQAGTVLVEYLTEWLHNHTRLPDRMLGAFLRNQRRACTMTFSVATSKLNSGR